MIYLSGGSGFIGRNLAQALKEQGYDFLILSRKGEDVVTDYSYASLVKIFQPGDCIIHLAGVRGTDQADGEVNLQLTKTIGRAARDAGVDRIILASSISVYSDSSLLPWREDQLATPAGPYGRSKLQSENFLLNMAHESDIAVICLRLAHVFGAFEQNNYMINRFLRQGFQGDSIVLFNDEPAKREFIYVKDVARAMILALQSEKTGVFNIGGTEALTNREVAEMIHQVMMNQETIVQEGEIGQIEPSYMDSTKAKRLLGYKPIFSFRQAVEDIKQLMTDAKITTLGSF